MNKLQLKIIAAIGNVRNEQTSTLQESVSTSF